MRNMSIAVLSREAASPAAVLIADPQACTGCRWCEIACSVWHEGVSSPVLSRIRILNPEARGDVFMPVVCQQCAEAPCAAVCPKEAISRCAAAGMVRIDYTRCIACRACVTACPFGAMNFDAGRSRVFKCDLCGGTPHCAAVCEPGALRFEDGTELQLRRMRHAADRILAARHPAGGQL